MTAQVKIISGKYRGAKLENVTLPMHRPVVAGAKGDYVTVDATEILGEDFAKIRVMVDDYEYVGDTPVSIKQPTKTETDEQVMDRIEERFEILNEMTRATMNGDVRAMIVVGPPGVGKSYGVENELSETGILDDLAGRPRSYEVVKGAMTPIGLYCKLYEYSEKNKVLVFDDCDSVLMDDLSLNILKAALDSSKKRTIHWNADSSKLRNEGVPNKFNFHGSVIFITNIKFDHVRSAKLKDHLEALMSRCHYLDLTLDTMRDKFLRIKQIARTGGLFKEYGMDNQGENEIITYMEQNQSRLREMSLRMAIKLADLRRMSPGRWMSIAENTCMKSR
jgi:predicted AAA+ superfamily ATPase